MSTHPQWRQLSIAIIGGGLGGLSAALGLRRQGHKVTIYERADFAGEKGASVSCAANGTRWLREWKCDIPSGDPVILEKLISHDWKTGDPISVVDLADYEERWGDVYNMFHRQYMHAMLRESACGEHGDGIPVTLKVNHRASDFEVSSGTITFENGLVAVHDVIIGADGIGSVARNYCGFKVERKPADVSCLHTNVMTEDAIKLGLVDYSKNSALEYWGGQGSDYKIVLSPCNGGKLLSYYCFFPREKGDFQNQSWDAEASVEDLLAPFPDLDLQVRKHLEIGIEIKPWRLWVHQPYPTWQNGCLAIMGDAAHPMMPHQSQGACMAIEDAAAFSIVFSKKNFNGDVRQALEVYQDVRKPRATKVQAASVRAMSNMHERIGFSSNTDDKHYKVADEKSKLTIEEMNEYDMHAHIESELVTRRRMDAQQEMANTSPVPLQTALRA